MPHSALPPYSGPQAKSVSEVFEAVAEQFGVTSDELIAEYKGGKAAINMVRNIAVWLALAYGHSRKDIATFAGGRNHNFVRMVQVRFHQQPKQVMLAWGLWRGWGGEWLRFMQMSCQMPVSPVPEPATEDYVLSGKTQATATGKVEPVAPYFDASLGLSQSALSFLGLDDKYVGERSVACNLIRLAVTDYLTGLDAERWLNERLTDTNQGISFSNACGALGINDSWLRRKVKRMATVSTKGWKSKEEPDD